MNLFWPGIIVGTLLLVMCAVAYAKRSWFSRIIDGSISTILGKKPADDTDEGQGVTPTHLMIPLLGGMIMGLLILVMSVTGVMR